MKSFATENYGSKEETYVYTANDKGHVSVNTKTNYQKGLNFKSTVLNFFESAFLPQGYPQSVSGDYLEYQIWDTSQAFCSSITGMLATHAMLKSYGVGDESATVLAASLTWMLKDGAGMIGRILFAWMKGTQLDCDAKRWRLFADVLNDAAIFLDLLAPVFSKSYFMAIACVSSVARSIVGVAGGATRAALTLHQARRDNMADVSAKDGSQETLVNLMALVAGFIITPLVSEKPMFVWSLFFIFTFLHLCCNYWAVSSVIMETVNLPRLYILLFNYLQHETVLSPKEVSKLDPVLRAPGYIFKINIGTRLKCALSNSTTDDIPEGFTNRMYVVGLSKITGSISVALHRACDNHDVIKASFQSLLVDILLAPTLNEHKLQLQEEFKRGDHRFGGQKALEWNTAEKMIQLTDALFPNFEQGLVAKGWDLNRSHLGADEWRFEWKSKTH